MADEKQNKRDMIDEMELGEGFASMMRHGAVVMAACVALAGWYFSQEFGRLYLYIGVGAGLLVGGLMFMLASLSRAFVQRVKRKMGDDE